VDRREALATLSEMQAAIATVRAEFDLQEVKSQLRALGEALAAAKAPETAAEALLEGDLARAARELDQLDLAKLERTESEVIAQELQELANTMQEAQQFQLSEGTRQMAQGLEQQDVSKANRGVRQLAEVCRQQALREGLDQRLANQLSQLAESKASARSRQSGGQARGRPDRPSDTWGRGSTGNPLGDQSTSIETNRQRVEISGVQGEGPSERETTRVSESSQAAERGYREQYQEYRKMNEAVLQSEALPLGHRQTIRRYFETIHPDQQAMQRLRQAARPRQAN
jgi:hypothetical protein